MKGKRKDVNALTEQWFQLTNHIFSYHKSIRILQNRILATDKIMNLNKKLFQNLVILKRVITVTHNS